MDIVLYFHRDGAQVCLSTADAHLRRVHSERASLPYATFNEGGLFSIIPADKSDVRFATTMNPLAIEIDKRQIAEFCRRHHIEWLSLFGSILRPDFRPDSDVDVLVEFEPDHTPGWDFFGMQEELSAIIGRQVDLNTPGFLSRYFRDEVRAGALPIYESKRD